MDIYASIIDQRVVERAERADDVLTGELHRRKSQAFTLLCASTLLDLPETEALELLTDGGNDQGVDAIHIGATKDGEFTVTLFQSKYKQDLEGRAAFEANAIQKVIAAIRLLMDPSQRLLGNSRLTVATAELRSLILDGLIPRVRVVLCNNGRTWDRNGQDLIDAAGFPADVVTWEHLNHERLVTLLQRRKTVTDTLSLTGEAIVESFDYRRVLVGKLPVAEVKRLFSVHGDILLDRNIRRYLGENRVNQGIHDTLKDPGERSNFYFYNNGITAVCSKFTHNALQRRDFKVRVEDLQIINGGQTCRTIQRTLDELADVDFDGVYVLIRLYEVADSNDQLVSTITYATNSQNPVDLLDLKANDRTQLSLETGLKGLGYDYKRKRDSEATPPTTITIGVAAEAVLAVWRKQPHNAKFRRSRLFSDFYDLIFSKNLTAAQVIIAVLIFRFVEGERRRPSLVRPTPAFVPYASHFLAMIIGVKLLEQSGEIVRGLADLNHVTYPAVLERFERDKVSLYREAARELAEALVELGVHEDADLPRLAAQFRRGDLLSRRRDKWSLGTPLFTE